MFVLNDFYSDLGMAVIKSMIKLNDRTEGSDSYICLRNSNHRPTLDVLVGAPISHSVQELKGYKINHVSLT